LGLKSSASILPEISRTIAISIPSVVTFSPEEKLCGRASAIINNPIAINLTANGMCLKYSRNVEGTSLKIFKEEYLTDDWVFIPLNKYQAIINGMIAKK
jgi:hypothetical protein